MGAGGKGGGGAGAHDYYGTIADLSCAGPVDAVLGIMSDGKTVWPDADGGDWESGNDYEAGTTVRSGGRAWVCASNHFSGDTNRPAMPGAPWSEYVLNRTDDGVTNPVSISVPGYGIALLFWGTDDQELPEGLPEEFADNHPPYRRQCWVLFQDWLFGRERTSAPNLQVLVRRAPRQTVITGPAAGLDSQGQANPLAFAAEVLSDSVFGAGNPDLISSISWQAAADVLQERPDLWNVSPFITDATTFDAFADAVGSYVNAFKRGDGAGRVEVGILPTAEEPPVFDSRLILDTSCLCEPLDITTETGASNQVTVKYYDRVRSFKARNAKATDTLSRGDLAGEAISLDRPWITRAAQAAFAASDALRRSSEPGFSGRAVCLAERVRHIREGSVFLLQDPVTRISVPCRCDTITEAAPPSIRRTITFRAETGFTPILALDGSGETVGGAPPAAETVTAFQLLQPPPSLVDGEKFALLALVGRTSPVTTSVRVWMQESDPTLFADLGSQSGFAVAGTLAADYPDTIPASGHTQDDNSEALRITFDPETPAADIAALGETQTADSINDSRLLVFLFSAADPSVFEIATVKAVRIGAGETFYRLKVRRARYGTAHLDGETGDRAFIIRRASLTPYTHQRFGSYAVSGQAVTLRLQASNPWKTADLADPAVCPDRSFTFGDPYAPRCQWTAIEQRPNSGTAWAAVTDFTTDHPLGTQFRIVFTARDATGDLATASIRAAGPAETTNALYLEAVSGAEDEVVAIVSLPEGDWSPYSQITDRTGRLTQTSLTAVGGSTPVAMRVRNPGSTLCANPVAVPRGIAISEPVAVTLTCSTPASAIEYQVVALNAAPGGSWTTYSGPLTVDPDSTLYARATASGFTGSPTVKHGYRYQDPDAVG